MPVLQLVPGAQTLCDTPFLGYLRRRCPDHARDLCCYRVARNGRFCIGKWVSRSRGLVLEITSYASPGELTRADVDFIDYWLSDRRLNDRQTAFHELEDRRRAADRAQSDGLREAQEYRQFEANRAGVPEEALLGCL